MARTAHQRPNASNANTQARSVIPLVTIAGAILIVLDLIGSFSPGAWNWGFHHLGFLNTVFRFGILIVMVTVLLPSVQLPVLDGMKRFARRIAAMESSQRRLAAAASLALIGLILWLLRERLFLLGDGGLMLRTLPTIEVRGEIAYHFSVEPFSAMLYWIVSRASSPEKTLIVVQLLSVGCGLATVIVAWRFARQLVDGAIERILAAAGLAGVGMIPLFAGYVEVYPPVLPALLLFFYLGYLSLVHGRSHVYHSLAFGLLISMHFAMLAFAPVWLILLGDAIRRRKYLEALSGCVAALFKAIVLLSACGHSLDSVVRAFSDSSGTTVPLGETSGFPYTMFSAGHALELLNLFLLVAPLSLPLALLPFLPRVNPHTPALKRLNLFLPAVAVCGIVAVFLVNPELGMSRDWDLMGVFFFGVVVASLIMFLQTPLEQQLRLRALFIVTFLTIMHVIPALVVNAGEKESLTRFEILIDEHRWSASARARALEELAVYHRDQNRYKEALSFYSLASEIDPANSRLLQNIAWLGERVGDANLRIASLRQAVERGNRDWKLHMELAGLYAERGLFDSAIVIGEKALVLQQQSADVWNFVGRLYMEGKQDYESGIRCFDRAMAINPGYLQPYLNAARCHEKLHNLPKMHALLTRLIKEQPGSAEAGEARKLLATTP